MVFGRSFVLFVQIYNLEELIIPYYKVNRQYFFIHLRRHHTAKDLLEKMSFSSMADFRSNVSAGGVPGIDITLKDVKAAEVIWGCSVLKMKGNTMRRNGKWIVQSIIKVPTELIKLY